MNLQLIAYAFLCLLSIPSKSQSNSDKIKEMMEAANIPGLSLAYFEDGVIQSVQGYGYKSSETKEPINVETVFSAASLSKPVFACVVLHLAQERKIDLDQPLHLYYDYPDLKHDERYENVTARLVLSHTSGLPNWRKSKLKFWYDPGEQFNYSGEGYVWLQKTIESITNKSIEVLAQEKVFKPLKMTRTAYMWNAELEKDFAIPHKGNTDIRKKYRPDSPNAAASLQTTASDYAKFLIWLSQQIDSGNPTYLSMVRPHVVPTKSNKDNKVSWGLGIGIQKTDKGVEFWHWGDNNTFKAYFTFSPERNRGLVYFTNGTNGLSITPDIVSLFMASNQPGWIWNGYKYYKD